MGGIVILTTRKWVAGWLSAFCLVSLCPYVAGAEAEPPPISSLSAVVYEPESGRVLMEKDAHTPRAMASTTKLMTALLAMELCAPDEEITVPKEAVLVEGSSLGLRAGDKITMSDLVTGLLLESGNDAANTIAMVVSGSLPAFAEKMNAKAAELGMKESTFVTPSGLDEGGHAASAYDMALLGAAVLKNPRLAEIVATKTAVISFGDPQRRVTVSNHNKLLSLYPYAVGMKTGFTKKSGRCLVSAAKKDGVTLVVVTLNGGDYWNDHMALYEKGFSMTEAMTPELPPLPPLPVGGGMTGSIQLTAETPPAFTLLKGEGEKLETRVELPPFLFAPVVQGEQVGCVRYLLEGRELGSVPIKTAYKVDERPTADFGGRMSRFLRELLTAFFRL